MDVEKLDEHHFDVLDRLASGFPLKLASRHQDQIRRKLRECGLIAHCGKPKRWQISDAGLAIQRSHREGGQER